ncbi:MAG: right-handed parallel beta-helix repeat-containing protein [bacterium JZ-2024 1]
MFSGVWKGAPAPHALMYVAPGTGGGKGTRARPFRGLDEALEKAPDGATLILLPGTYEATAHPATEPFCGNCLDPKTTVSFTYGWKITGKSVILRGTDAERTLLKTNSGYGVFIENAGFVEMAHLTITGGVRDKDGSATDAGVVVRHARVYIHDTRIIGNNNQAEGVIVGVGGVMGREGAVIILENSRIEDNSWDGVALYRGATLMARDNVIRKGRGAGFGITWDATATLIRNEVTGYWKGIGYFGESRGVVFNNIVHHNLGWGIIATGNAEVLARNNISAYNGNCGFAVWEETARATLENSIIAFNGWRDQWVCPRVGIWTNAGPDHLSLKNNLVFGHPEGNYSGIEDPSGSNGNLSADPLFASENDFRLRPGSPGIDGGREDLLDLDGTRSDMGAYGGAFAKR